MKVLTLIDRDTRQAKSTVIADLTKDDIGPILRKNIAKEARLIAFCRVRMGISAQK